MSDLRFLGEIIQYAGCYIRLSSTIDPTDHKTFAATLALIDKLNQGLRSGDYGLYPLIVNQHGPPKLEYNKECRRIVAVYEYPEDKVVNVIELTDGFIVCDAPHVVKFAEFGTIEYTSVPHLRTRWLELFTNFFGSASFASSRGSRGSVVAKPNIKNHYREVSIEHNTLVDTVVAKHYLCGPQMQSVKTRHTVTLLRITYDELRLIVVHFIFYSGREFSHSIHLGSIVENFRDYGRLVRRDDRGRYKPTQTLSDHVSP